LNPKNIRNHIVRRVLNDDYIDPRVFEALEIDLKVAAEGEEDLVYPTLDEADTEDEIFQGVVPFELQVGVLGRTHTVDCRAVYTATLTDDGSIMAICTDVLGECEVVYQQLTWEPKNVLDQGRDGKPLPRWVPFEPGNLFSREIRLLIEKDALEQQESDS
jgi:hypothetical protein